MQIYDGREKFYQWDLNQKITHPHFKVGDNIHFVNRQQSTALVVEAYELDGKVVADVPNVLLQVASPIMVYRYVNDSTVHQHTFEVTARLKPDDYFYTETEIYTVEKAVESALQEAKDSGEFDGKDGINGVDGKDGYTPVKGVDYFDGVDGRDGVDGKDGYTPVKGVDYYTEEEKAEMIDAATPKWKTLVNVTLTEAQGGASNLLLAINDADTLANANKMRVFITFPVTQSWTNGAFTLTAYLSDETKNKYRVPILRESNVASSTNADFIASSYVDISDFTINSAFRTYCAISPKPNNYFTAPVNSFTSSRLLSGGYPSDGILTYAPYLEIVPTSNTITFEKGTRVFVEVQ